MLNYKAADDAKSKDQKIASKYLAICSSQMSQEGITTPLVESKYIPKKIAQESLQSVGVPCFKNDNGGNADLATV